MSSLQTTISTSAVSASRSATTSSIGILVSNTGGGTITYSWKSTGNACVTNNPSAAATTVTGGGIAGTTNLYCDVTNSVTGVTYPSPSCLITWLSTIPINSVTWSIPSATTSSYNGAAQSVTVSSIDPAAATYDTTTTSATNAGSIASTTITGNGDYEGTFTSPNLTIGTSTITIASSGSTSLPFTGAAINVGYTVSGVFAADTNYSVSGSSATNCNNYTVTLTNSSTNYTLGTPSTFAWSITPTVPGTLTASVASFSTITFNWSAVGGCTYELWYSSDNIAYFLLQDNLTGTSTTYNAPQNTTFYYYVVAVAPSGTSNRTRIAQVNVGAPQSSRNDPWDSGLSNLSPLCLSGSAGATSGAVGLKAFVQGTYGITVTSVVANSGSCNFATSLLYGTATRQAIFWHLNATGTTQLTGASSAPNPWSGNAQTRNVTQSTGTVNYYLRIPASAAGGAFPQSSGWSTNNSGGLSGAFWATISWRNRGTQVVIVPEVPSSVSYIA